MQRRERETAKLGESEIEKRRQRGRETETKIERDIDRKTQRVGERDSGKKKSKKMSNPDPVDLRLDPRLMI